MTVFRFPNLCFSCIALLALVLCAGCLGLGYQFGTKSLFGQDIQTVYVPVFECDAEHRDLAERLTEAVCKRIESRSPYKVIGRPTADSILEGRIVKKAQKVSVSNNYGDPRQKMTLMNVEINWHDRRDRALRQFESIAWNSGAGRITATNYLVAETGQSELTAMQQQIDTVADQIVGMMEVPW